MQQIAELADFGDKKASSIFNKPGAFRVYDQVVLHLSLSLLNRAKTLLSRSLEEIFKSLVALAY